MNKCTPFNEQMYSFLINKCIPFNFNVETSRMCLYFNQVNQNNKKEHHRKLKLYSTEIILS